MSAELRFRQIHLDYHTSEFIPGIGAEFDPDRFVATLKDAAVDSITCFSRCHHGYIYHDTKFPYKHPHLTGNLLIDQVRACHQADIKVPVYITVGWDHLMAQLHTEWCEIGEDGNRVNRKPLDSGWGWYNMDFASPYVDFLEEQTAEICEMLGDELDGVFFDIIFQRGVHNSYCLERFEKLGWNPKDQAKQHQMRALLVNEVTDRLMATVRSKSKDCTVFFNGGHIGPDFRQRIHNYTHLEAESLPSGGWGYMHFPMTSRYARTLGLDFLGMTGKFSEMWGHFSSYKNQSALEFECFSSLAQGGKCSVGDQLPPNGVLDGATYDLIGSVYRQIRDVEPWCVGARAVTEIGVLNSEEFGATVDRMDARNLGVARMLMEGRHQFDFVDTTTDLTKYTVLILSDGIQLSDTTRIEQFLAKGGSMLVAGATLLDESGNVWPVFQRTVTKCDGELSYSPDFLRPSKATGLRTDTDYVMYERGLSLTATPDAEVFATISEPYFERNWKTFCSHAHTPVATQTDKPGVLVARNLAVFAHPIFTTYAHHSMSFHRDLVLKLLKTLLPTPLLSCPGPTSLQATLTRQGDRHIIHLLHYIPERRGLKFDIVEDPMPVAATEITVRVQAKTATLVPFGTDLPLRMEGDVCVVSVPAFVGKAMICLE